MRLLFKKIRRTTSLPKGNQKTISRISAERTQSICSRNPRHRISQALDLIRNFIAHLAFKERPHLVILDLGLPDYSGEEVLIGRDRYKY
jgi:hypothetical protein